MGHAASAVRGTYSSSLSDAAVHGAGSGQLGGAVLPIT